MEIKDKKCKVCKSLFKPFKTTQSVCSTSCAIIDARAKSEKKIKFDLKEKKIVEKKRIDKMKIDIMTYSQACGNLQVVINSIIREIDRDRSLYIFWKTC